MNRVTRPHSLLLTGVATLATAGGLIWIWLFGHPAPLTSPKAETLALLQGTPETRGEPVQPLPETPPLDPGRVALGRRLFHDPRLSRDNRIACASCHHVDEGGADNRVHSLGVGGAEGEINSPSVLNARYNFRQFWDGRAGSLEDQVNGPLTNPVEMASSWQEVLPKLREDRELAGEFNRVFGRGISAEHIRIAISDYERSLAHPSRFDRWLRGNEAVLNPDEKAGYRVFKARGCVACHQGVNLGGNLYQRFGVMADYFADRPTTHADLGRFNVTGRAEDKFVFKVPSLRNVALTAPYFHDGSAKTLEEAIRTMGRYQLGLDLSSEDVVLIAGFLRTLNGEAPAPGETPP